MWHSVRSIISGMIFAVGMAVTIIGPAIATAPVQITPVQFVIEKGRPIVTMTVKSSSDSTQLYQIDLKKWHVVNSDAQLSDSDQSLIVTPPIFELKGGQTQTIRLGLLKPVDTSVQEQAWRVILRDITPQEVASNGSMMFVRMNISMPIFVPADNPKPLDVNAHAALVGDGKIKLSFENVGNRHGHIVEAQLLDAAGVAVAGKGISHYVLPGQISQATLQVIAETQGQQAAIENASAVKLVMRNHVSREVTELIVPLQGR